MTDEELNHLLALSNLSISEDQKEKLKKEIEDIVSFFDLIKDVNTDEVVESGLRLGPLKMREDVASPSNMDLVHYGSQSIDSFYTVPKVIEE